MYKLVFFVSSQGLDKLPLYLLRFFHIAYGSVCTRCNIYIFLDIYHNSITIIMIIIDIVVVVVIIINNYIMCTLYVCSNLFIFLLFLLLFLLFRW